MNTWLLPLIMVAGGMGAACRYLLDDTIGRRMRGVLPLGTMVVNVSGALALGVVWGLMSCGGISTEVAMVVGGGFLGAYTTFSTWMYESLRLVEEGARRAAAINLLGSLLAGGAACAAGWGLVIWLAR
ncbi:MAG: fluoride efflux transporter CrcB [Phycisphaeraceae bacterium]|nr:fluoride efflux transporter CrcB [Phycisphaeraceae bacterium]